MEELVIVYGLQFTVYSLRSFFLWQFDDEATACAIAGVKEKVATEIADMSPAQRQTETKAF